MSNQELLLNFLNNVRLDIIGDLKAKQISDGDLNMAVSATDEQGDLSGNDYWYYTVHGRAPGKQPPPETIVAWITKRGINPNGISINSLAYLIGRKIGQIGTDIYTGKRPGMAFEQIIQHNGEQFRGELQESYLNQFRESFSKDLKEIFA